MHAFGVVGLASRSNFFLRGKGFRSLEPFRQPPVSSYAEALDYDSARIP
jgi:hypothetical protein